jgi:plastocyanin
VPPGELGKLLGIRRVSVVHGSQALAVVDAPLVSADNGPRRGPAETQTVQISNFQFQPQELTVTAGTTVAWLNRDQTVHNIVSKDGKVASPGLDTDDRYTVVFEHEGDYPYFCALHPQMTGVVHVRAG